MNIQHQLFYSPRNWFVPPLYCTDSVTKEISEADRKKIMELEESAVTHRNEISKLKEISEVATSQVKTLEMVQLSREKENASLRQQLLDFQIQSDEKTIIGEDVTWLIHCECNMLFDCLLSVVGFILLEFLHHLVTCVKNAFICRNIKILYNLCNLWRIFGRVELISLKLCSVQVVYLCNRKKLKSMMKKNCEMFTLNSRKVYLKEIITSTLYIYSPISWDILAT